MQLLILKDHVEEHWSIIEVEDQKMQFSERLLHIMGIPGGSVVKNLPANTGDVVWSLGQEDPLGKEMATHSSIFAWKIPQTEEPGELQSTGSQKSQTQLSD